jgi:Ca2+-binding RTX toxin-like protein
MADITGTGANDILVGTNDDDTLNGLVGADTMAGGNGNDVYFADQVGDVVTELKNNGSRDGIVSAVSAALGANVENLELVADALNGTGNALDNTILGSSLGNTIHGVAGNDLLAGNAGDDTLTGGAGDDFLDGGSGQNLLIGGDGNDGLSGWLGANVMQGGAGNDYYNVYGADDEVIELAGQGVDWISSDESFDLSLHGKNVENLFLAGANLTGIGNDLDNEIGGNSGDDVLEGRAGNDTLFGSAGKDTLNGGDGNDTLDGEQGGDDLSGGKGNDVYYIDDAADTITELDGDGIDEIRTDDSVDLNDIAAEIENVTLTEKDNVNAYGSDLNNILAGNAGNNTLDGREGNDTLIGGKGHDFYYVDSAKDVVGEKADEGTDTVRSIISYALSTNVENLELQGGGAIDGTGNALDNDIDGNSGNNNLAGAAGDDDLSGRDGNDTLQGGEGNDYLDGGSGNDRMEGGKGDEIYYVDSKDDQVVEAVGQGFDTVRTSLSFDLAVSGANVERLELIGATKINGSGNALDNILEGNSAANTLAGAGGDDGIDGGDGDDLLTGDDGNDYLSGNDGNDTVQGGDGNDDLRGERDNDVLEGGVGHDTLDGGDGSDTMTGGAGNDVYWLSSNDTVIEVDNGGTDTVIDDETIDLATSNLANIENLILTGDAAADGYGDASNNIITGNGADNQLYGDLGDDTLLGGGGADELVGGGGKDKMSGGTGDDIYYVDDLGDQVEEKLNEGFDILRTNLSTYVLNANFENLEFETAGGVNGTGNALANNIYGNAGNDVLDGKAGDDYVYGNAGDDTLTGGVGNDLLYGGAGNDVMTGGKGDDIYYIDNKDDKITELSGQGVDLIFSDISLKLSDKAFVNIEYLALQGTASNASGNALANAITGNGNGNGIDGGAGNDTLDGVTGDDSLDGAAGDDSLVGGTGNDTLLGGDGRDTLSGGDGNDSLSGGAGNDVYIASTGTDTIEELAKGGIDELRSTLDFSLAGLANVENLTLVGPGAYDGTGNTLANVIKGNDLSNDLYGGAGNDTLIGGAGEDDLGGDAGDDKMIGGADNDFYYVDSAKDAVIESKNQGVDTVYTALNYTLGANVEQLIIEGTGDTKGTGNALDNFIEGNAGKNKLDGAAGNDRLRGGDGDDLLVGGLGNDQLYGGAGNDTMIGGAGNDTYLVVDNKDKIVELAGQGIDTVLTERSFDLSLEGVNVENLKAEVAKNYILIGNALNNTITAAESGDDTIDGGAGNDSLLGGEGSDSIVGGAGNDTLIGGKGNDTLEGGAGNDTYYLTADVADDLTEAAGQGIDTVVTYQAYTLGANLENLVFLGSNEVNGTGNELANAINGSTGKNRLSGLAGNDTLNGGDGNDTLDGGSGKDVMRGGAGDDWYIVGEAADTVSENAKDGEHDRVVSLIAAYALGANIEELAFDVGAVNVVGSGNALDNWIEGDAGNDALDGKAGNDEIIGGAGNDSMTGGSGHDTLQGGMGNDSLLGGDGDDDMVGEAGDDVMIGGAGNDTYSVDSDGDSVQEASKAGIDTVIAEISLTLGANIENSRMSANGVTVTGNELDNRMEGSYGKDTINGAAGADLLASGAGDDVLNGDAGNDVIEGDLGADTINGGAGNDLILYRLDDPNDLDKLGGDLITGFETGKDKIDLYDLFTDFDIHEADVIGEGYLRLQVNGNDTVLQFDKDGGGDGFVTLATVQNVTNLSLTDLIIPQGLGID